MIADFFLMLLHLSSVWPFGAWPNNVETLMKEPSREVVEEWRDVRRVLVLRTQDRKVKVAQCDAFFQFGSARVAFSVRAGQGTVNIGRA